MQAIPKLTTQRLAELPPGTPIRLGSQLVTFSNCSIRPDYKGDETTFVDYLDPEGKEQTHCESTVLQCGTEFIDAVMCKYCGKFRQPGDIRKKPIEFWDRAEPHEFCADTECAKRYQQTIRVPSQTRTRLTMRKAS